MAKCPRCGHDEPRDITQMPSGDHLIQRISPMVTMMEPSYEDNMMVFRAHQDVEFKWCSEVNE